MKRQPRLIRGLSQRRVRYASFFIVMSLINMGIPVWAVSKGLSGSNLGILVAYATVATLISFAAARGAWRSL